jgi:protein SCO1/2
MRLLMRAVLGVVLMMLALKASPVRGAPVPVAEASIVERLDQPVDPALAFVDERGRSVTLGSFFGTGRPVLLTMNYFRCRTLCDVQLRQLTQSLRALDGLPGQSFRVLTVSIDPRDAPAAAAERRAGYLAQAGRADLDWHFLVGAEPQIRALADQLGFGYRYDERSGQYAHAPMTFMLSPSGRIVRYLYGLDHPPAALRMALVEASRGQIGRTLDKLILSCFQFDGAAGRYGLYVIGLVRVGGVLTLFGLALLLLRLRRKELGRGS